MARLVLAPTRHVLHYRCNRCSTVSPPVALTVRYRPAAGTAGVPVRVDIDQGDKIAIMLWADSHHGPFTKEPA